ncbi:MAG: MerR family transcriptional regulator [Bacteroidetes bacterium]|nr:MerR family transcriptional regulator [Bacteroidota bacterium]
MNHFTIKDIENLTGIKSHTLRIWEQRYGIPLPKRTSTNIRYYDDDDLKMLLNVSMLNRQGHSISHLTALSKEELEQLALVATSDTGDTNIQLDAMLQAMFNLDEHAFDRILSSHLMKFGMEKTMVELFFPFLKKIGVLWQTGQVNPAFEHFMSNLIRQKMIVAIDAQASVKNANSKKFILFLPESEIHELGLLFANYVIRSRGHHTIYLGQNLPYTELDAIVTQFDCDYILSVLTNIASKLTTQEFVNKLSSRFKDKKYY